uniref:Protein phosphatase 1 regulatory subunit 15A/B C-terminal domain-containing protein n=2 Tax=Denticeps clupeoides TaxID=299321 RepID=A0AAY4DZ74_9TELE
MGGCEEDVRAPAAAALLPDSHRITGASEEVQAPAARGYLSSARNFLSTVFTGTYNAPTQGPCRPVHGATWWGRGGAAPHSWLSVSLWNKEETAVTSPRRHHDRNTGDLCHPARVAAATQPSQLFVVRCEDENSKRGESAGPCCNKTAADKGGLHAARPESLSNPDRRADGARTATACSEVAVLTPDQDNGYSSLEEEQSGSRVCGMRRACEEEEEGGGASVQGAPAASVDVPNVPEEGQKRVEDSPSEVEEEEEDAPTARPPQCQNKAIAYIMGGPGSGESSSDSDFDSEDSSDFSEDCEEDASEDEDGDERDTTAVDEETERLWNSLCQNHDPYNPCNFTASLCTVAPLAPPQGVPASSPLSQADEDSWGEDEEDDGGCEVDEAENLQLWNAFISSADPYSPLNFQAPLRTQKPPHHTAVPQYKMNEAEDRLDSGFSEDAPLPGWTATRSKKVRFQEEVEEFYASSDEDRHGPWEEFARDRCRFQRRVQEVEERISFCLSPAFRRVVYDRLYPASF